MSLLVWLPFTNNNNNHGLGSTVTIAAAKGSLVDNGKLGKCFKTTTSGDISLNYSSDIINNKDMSFGGWFKFNKSEIQTVVNTKTYSSTQNSLTGNLIGSCNYGGFGLVWETNNLYTSNKELTSIGIFSNIRTSTVFKSTTKINIDFDTWIHVFVTWNKSTNTIKLYKNGSLFYSSTVDSFSDCINRNICINYSAVYGGNGPSSAIPFYTNDIRLYDYTLSSKEVKELAKGLVLHYPLSNSGDGADNILPGTVQNETTYTYPTSSYNDKCYKKTSIIPSASTYTLSFYAKSTVNGDKIRAHYYSPNTTVRGESSQGAVTTSSDGNMTFTLSTDWKKYWVTYAQNATTAAKTIIFPRMGSVADQPGMSGTGTVSIRNVKFEEGNKSTVWKPNSTDTAYNTLNYNSTIEYDTSGNGYNGTKNGTFTYDTNTARNSISTKFSNSNYISLTSPTSEVKTVSFWAKWDSIPSGQSILFLDYKSRIGFGLASNGIIPGVYTGNYNTFDKSVLSANTWYHFVIVNTGTDYTSLDRKLYINGVEQTATSNVNHWTYSIDETQIGKRSTSSDGLVGNMTDLRLYATALSADDIKELYQAPVSISDNGTIFTQGEFIEN